MTTQEARSNVSGPGICYVVLIAQLAVHIVLLRAYFRLVGQPGDVGSNYLAFWALAVLPATILFALVIRVAYERWVGREEKRRVPFFASFGLVDVALLLSSFVVYANAFQG